MRKQYHVPWAIFIRSWYSSVIILYAIWLAAGTTIYWRLTKPIQCTSLFYWFLILWFSGVHYIKLSKCFSWRENFLMEAILLFVYLFFTFQFITIIINRCIVTWEWSLAKEQYMVEWLLTGATPPPPPQQRYWQNRETANLGLVSSVGGYVRYISPHIIIIINLRVTPG